MAEMGLKGVFCIKMVNVSKIKQKRVLGLFLSVLRYVVFMCTDSKRAKGIKKRKRRSLLIAQRHEPLPGSRACAYDSFCFEH